MSVNIVVNWMAADQAFGYQYDTKKEAMVKYKELVKKDKYATLVKKTTVTSIDVEVIK
jgi:hypothetical protein